MHTSAKHHTPHPVKGGNGDTLSLEEIDATLAAGLDAARRVANFQQVLLAHGPEEAVANFQDVALPGSISILSSADATLESKQEAVKALVSLPSPPVSALMEALKIYDGDARSSIVRALGRISGSEAVDALICVLEDKNQVMHCRLAAAQELGKRSGSTVLNAFLNVIRDRDEFPELRNSARWALVEIGSSAVPSLIEMVKDDDEMTRCHAEFALIRIGPPVAAAINDALRPQGIRELLGFDPSGRREKLRDVLREIESRKKAA